MIPQKRYTSEEVISLITKKWIRIGFSGSRQRYDAESKQLIIGFVDLLPKDRVVISGGCISEVKDPITKKCFVNENTDQWSVKRAEQRGLKTTEHVPTYPDLERIQMDARNGLVDSRAPHWYKTKRNYLRNQDIVDDSDVLIALLKTWSGGTNHTVNRALIKGIPVFVNIDPSDGWIRFTKKHRKIPVDQW